MIFLFKGFWRVQRGFANFSAGKFAPSASEEVSKKPLWSFSSLPDKPQFTFP